MEALGLGATLNGRFIEMPNGPNKVITIYNSGILLNAIFHITGFSKYFISYEATAVKKRLPLLMTAYLAVAAFAALIIYAACAGITPPFIIQGIGPTPIGRAVLGMAIILIEVCSFFNIRYFTDKGTLVIRLYSTGLALFAIGLSGVFLQKAVGTPIGWAGRASQYVGGAFLLIGVLSFWRKKAELGVTFKEALDALVMERTKTLSRDNEKLCQEISDCKKIEEELKRQKELLGNIINSSPDFIFVKDTSLRTLICNISYAAAVGKKPEEMIGHTDIENGWDPELVRGNPQKGIRGFENDDKEALSGKVVHNTYDPANSRKGALIFDTFKIPLMIKTKKYSGFLVFPGISPSARRQRTH
ncbi:MAG: PAS domain-containing protein [Candidatus Omnitrophica bacterium]|nr:PAS domain-containing protein [Candidatus Omnitrophota bacterium]